ncbi:MAG TPA: DNA alkylation repair protein [Candidatus Solibacter sp.]|nr:DNA alkylation repair protein [Candidatus Solibacter sp.]
MVYLRASACICGGILLGVPMTVTQVLDELHARANPANVAGMARYGISTKGTLGVPVNQLRVMARKIGRDHALAAQLWASRIHEARILATIIDDPKQVTRRQMDVWAREIDSWDVCDQACQNLFRYTPHAWAMAVKWARSNHEFMRRAGFSLMAGLAGKDKTATDEEFVSLFPLLAAAAIDERNMVKKALNWALRAIGKRNPNLRKQAIAAAREIHAIDSKSARWIASDAIRELSAESRKPPRKR